MRLQAGGLGDPGRGRALALLGEQAGQRLRQRRGGIGREGGELGGAFLVGGGPGLQDVGGLAPEAGVELGHRLGLQGLRRRVARYAAGVPDPVDRPRQAALPGEEVRQRAAPAFEAQEHRLEGCEVERHGEPRIGLRHPALAPQRQPRHGPAGGVGDAGRRRVVHHPEARRDAGLQREPPQQFLAEGVDGLDLQPARRLQRAPRTANGRSTAPRRHSSRGSRPSSSASCSVRRSSPSTAQSPSRPKRRRCISAAAALV